MDSAGFLPRALIIGKLSCCTRRVNPLPISMALAQALTLTLTLPVTLPSLSDGPSLILVMQDEVARDLLLRFSQLCQAVVCCRVSPDQKR